MATIPQAHINDLISASQTANPSASTVPGGAPNGDPVSNFIQMLAKYASQAKNSVESNPLVQGFSQGPGPSQGKEVGGHYDSGLKGVGQLANTVMMGTMGGPAVGIPEAPAIGPAIQDAKATLGETLDNPQMARAGFINPSMSESGLLDQYGKPLMSESAKTAINPENPPVGQYAVDSQGNLQSKPNATAWESTPSEPSFTNGQPMKGPGNKGLPPINESIPQEPQAPINPTETFNQAVQDTAPRTQVAKQVQSQFNLTTAKQQALRINSDTWQSLADNGFAGQNPDQMRASVNGGISSVSDVVNGAAGKVKAINVSGIDSQVQNILDQNLIESSPHVRSNIESIVQRQLGNAEAMNGQVGSTLDGNTVLQNQKMFQRLKAAASTPELKNVYGQLSQVWQDALYDGVQNSPEAQQTLAQLKDPEFIKTLQSRGMSGLANDLQNAKSLQDARSAIHPLVQADQALDVVESKPPVIEPKLNWQQKLVGTIKANPVVSAGLTTGSGLLGFEGLVRGGKDIPKIGALAGGAYNSLFNRNKPGGITESTSTITPDVAPDFTTPMNTQDIKNSTGMKVTQDEYNQQINDPRFPPGSQARILLDQNKEETNRIASQNMPGNIPKFMKSAPIAYKNMQSLSGTDLNALSKVYSNLGVFKDFQSYTGDSKNPFATQLQTLDTANSYFKQAYQDVTGSPPSDNYTIEAGNSPEQIKEKLAYQQKFIADSYKIYQPYWNAVNPSVQQPAVNTNKTPTTGLPTITQQNNNPQSGLPPIGEPPMPAGFKMTQ